ncbi:hypothetical protein KUTeg_012015 [Tegillarca granosa]|uniref:Uncharacterized protein n=1 Tax=Tegillarca granosa TaxID=220873 RepID=A0ABQ9F1W9_TEGGR|nr:hypothetical protein KUTeg_012015 [Tegillarca granosa]
MQPIIFICATMWHETYEEMKTLLTSLLRLDYDYACRRHGLQSNINEDEFDIDTHIFFDDAFESIEGSRKGYNAFVITLDHAVNDVIREHYSVDLELKPVSEFKTPYGCQKVWTLPGKSKLTVHFKDKKLIRNKKRWSQKN